MKRSLPLLLYWILFSLVTDLAQCVNVHFENKDGGFFLKQTPRQHFAAAGSSPLSGGGGSGGGGDSTTPSSSASSGSPLSTDRFTVFQSSQPISVRATYGPFSTKQTVPARYVVPDPLPVNATGPSVDLQELTTHHLDMSAHIVRSEIPRDSPVLRVLFHTGSDPANRHRQLLLSRHPQQRVCIVLHATLGTRPTLKAACSPDGEDGVCLAQITIPNTWWPPMPSPDKDGRPGKVAKSPQRVVQVAYSVMEPRPDDGEGCHPKMQIQPSTVLGGVPLVAAKGAYKEVRLTDAVTMLVPHPALFPKSRMHVSVFVDREKAKMLTAIVVRARVKSGVRILEAATVGPSAWNMTVEINPRHTVASATLIRLEAPDTEKTSSNGEVTELFTWLLEIVEDEAEPYEGARVVWTARFEPHQNDAPSPRGGGGEVSHRVEGRKSITRFDVQKDDIQAVVPISKNWEVLNTAVLTGRQVSQAMKVFIVSQAGKAADVTFQASCHSEDDNVLKVSSSCSSVYVDGSEARGSVNGSVLVKYGTYIGLARFTVWMPEFPLDLQLPDTKLSQLKSWRVPDYHSLSFSSSSLKARRRKKRSWDDLGNIVDKATCRLRYQQSPVDVYAHFMATDHDTGRISYLINRRTWLRVTDLVLPSLRVSDPRIASLHGRILQGRSVGRSEVQVLSPITGRVIGAKEIRVGNDKIALERLLVQVVSGLQLNISPDGSIENGYIAETSVTRKLTAQYQEGLLDIELEFSDGTRTPLREISDSDYHLVVESLDPEVVAFAPMVASHHPRVIAVGEGNGDLLQVTLLLTEDCRSRKMKGLGPLATASASVVVDFTANDQHRPDILQNDGGGSYGGSAKRDFQDLQDILKGGRDDVIDLEPNVQARQYHKNRHTAHLTPLEISMYVLLAAFCCAIVVFVVSCVVYASKFKAEEVVGNAAAAPLSPTGLIVHREVSHRKPGSSETTTNVHDWVWLGRATLDNGTAPPSNRNSAATNSEMRITSNPLNLNYCDPDDCLATSFSNPTHINLPSSSSHIDSKTYSRSTRVGWKDEVASEPRPMSSEPEVWNRPTPPPPLPPHGLQQAAVPQLSPPVITEDYRPPVPPHRNIEVGGESVTTPQRKHHHHHHHHKGGNKSGGSGGGGRCHVLAEVSGDGHDLLIGGGDEASLRSAFEFDDDAPPSHGDENVQFVQYPKSPTDGVNPSGPEVKKATIVGNPMFSATEEPPAVLDDLQLDMDYDQIMHYFDNLKESNT